MTLEPTFVAMAMTRSLPSKQVTLRHLDPIEHRRHCYASITVICAILGRSVSVSRVFVVNSVSKCPRCKRWFKCFNVTSRKGGSFVPLSPGSMKSTWRSVTNHPIQLNQGPLGDLRLTLRPCLYDFSTLHMIDESQNQVNSLLRHILILTNEILPELPLSIPISARKHMLYR